MTTLCCESCPFEPSCRDLVEAAFCRPEDITDEPNIVRGSE